MSLYSFGDTYKEWLVESSSRDRVRYAANQMCQDFGGTSTLLSGALLHIAERFAERRKSHPFEYQILVIQSDWFLDDELHSLSAVQRLVENDVVVMLVIPERYDQFVPMLGAEYNPQISETTIRRFGAAGAVYIRSSFDTFVNTLSPLEPVQPCE